ncbi:pea pathogenicity protein, partial [Mytilinidion resinicola]
MPQDGFHSIFERIDELSKYLRVRSRMYWTPGPHLAVDETIQRFMGRASEIVNIPSKPTPEGFKIWVLANQGYVLDWLWH